MEKKEGGYVIEDLINVVHHLEEKCSSVSEIHENLLELISSVSNTHQIILQDLNNIKTILNHLTKSQQDKFNDQKETLTILSTSSDDSLSTNENFSILPKSDGAYFKSSKSVTFSLDHNLHQDQEQDNRNRYTLKQFSKEKSDRRKTFDQIQ